LDASSFVGQRILSAIETVIKNWEREGINLHLPIAEPFVRDTLGAVGRPYSSDVVALYCATGGMEEGESDSHMWSLWSLERVVTENSRYKRPYILFADFLLDSHLYCFKYESMETSAVCVDYFNGEEPELVARSVKEFFEAFVTDAAKLRMFE
jgi:hypothetical protein